MQKRSLMSVKEMKETLLKRIEAADDRGYIESLLEYSNSWIEKDGQLVYRLSDAEKAAIRQGKEDIAAGRMMTDEEAEADLDAWFAEQDKKWGEK